MRAAISLLLFSSMAVVVSCQSPRADTSAPASKGLLAGVKTFDKNAAEALVNAFRTDPVAAKQLYAGVRWRFQAKVSRVDGGGSLNASITHVGDVSLTMKVPENAEKIEPDQVCMFEATAIGFDPGARTVLFVNAEELGGRFKNGVNPNLYKKTTTGPAGAMNMLDAK